MKRICCCYGMSLGWSSCGSVGRYRWINCKRAKTMASWKIIWQKHYLTNSKAESYEPGNKIKSNANPVAPTSSSSSYSRSSYPANIGLRSTSLRYSKNWGSSYSYALLYLRIIKNWSQTTSYWLRRKKLLKLAWKNARFTREPPRSCSRQWDWL